MSQANNLNVKALQRMLAELTNENKELKKQKKFGLVWEDKPDVQVLRVRDEAPMLREDITRAVVTDEKAQNHILINGDNFHALTALRATHASKVDVIYIDPPYNTGNKDFIYNDSFLDKENGYRHSKWLSFMEKRLTLAKELLSDVGVILVSIDDNEQARLKLLMDEVFGPENFISTIVAQLNPRGRQSSLDIAESHEYLLSYRKTSSASLTGEKLTVDQQKEYSKIDPENGLNYREIGLRLRGGRATAAEAPTLHFPLYVDSDTLEIYTETIPESNHVEIIPQFSDGTLGTWRWSKKKINAQKNELIARQVKRDGGYALDIFQKDYLKETKTRKHKSVWFGEGMNSDIGQKEIVSLLGKGNFDYPKPTTYLKKIMAMSAKKDAIVLDFFAGSGTTAHAVAELNKEDGGTRQCILVTDGGKTETSGESSKNAKEDSVNIAEEITYERVRRVLTGKDWDDGKDHEPLGGNLRYFAVEMEPTPYRLTTRDQRQDLEKYTIEHAKIATNIFNEIDSKNEMDDELGLPIDYKVFADEANARYLIGVNTHDYALTDLEEWFNTLPAEASVTMVGSGVEEIEWVRRESDRITVDDVLGRVIRSRKHVASKLPLI